MNSKNPLELIVFVTMFKDHGNVFLITCHSFVVYQESSSNSTKLVCQHTGRVLLETTMSERLMQLVQMIEFRQSNEKAVILFDVLN